jgi:hypothetical protein
MWGVKRAIPSEIGPHGASSRKNPYNAVNRGSDCERAVVEERERETPMFRDFMTDGYFRRLTTQASAAAYAGPSEAQGGCPSLSTHIRGLVCFWPQRAAERPLWGSATDSNPAGLSSRGSIRATDHKLLLWLANPT